MVKDFPLDVVPSVLIRADTTNICTALDTKKQKRVPRIALTYTMQFSMRQNLQKYIKWEILHEIKQRKPDKICIICNVERLVISLADSKTSLNSRKGSVSKFRQFANFYLKS